MTKRFYNYIILCRDLSIVILVFVVIALLVDKIVMPLYVSLGEKVQLPNVVDLTFNEGKQVLEARGFQIIKEEERSSPIHNPNTILAQRPEANAIVKTGRRVYVTVSIPEAPTKVPMLIGETEREARLLLSTHNLRIGTITYDFSTLIPKGNVYNQSLPQGTQVPRQTTVDLIISLGKPPEQIVVPDIVMKNLFDAESIIRDAGLTIGQIIQLKNDDLLPNTIIKQMPDAGTPAQKGDSITVVITVEKKSNPVN